MTKFIVEVKFTKIAIPDKFEFKTRAEAKEKVAEAYENPNTVWASHEEVKA